MEGGPVRANISTSPTPRRYGAYLAALPQEAVPLPCTWPDEDLDELQYDSLAAKVRCACRHACMLACPAAEERVRWPARAQAHPRHERTRAHAMPHTGHAVRGRPQARAKPRADAPHAPLPADQGRGGGRDEHRRTHAMSHARPRLVGPTPGSGRRRARSGRSGRSCSRPRRRCCGRRAWRATRGAGPGPCRACAAGAGVRGCRGAGAGPGGLGGALAQQGCCGLGRWHSTSSPLSTHTHAWAGAGG
jgi:hypothetical protein